MFAQRAVSSNSDLFHSRKDAWYYSNRGTLCPDYEEEAENSDEEDYYGDYKRILSMRTEVQAIIIVILNPSKEMESLPSVQSLGEEKSLILSMIVVNGKRWSMNLIIQIGQTIGSDEH